MSMTVTADGTALAFTNGVSLRVEVLTNVAATQNGNAANSHTAQQVSITTTVAGSRAYGAALNSNVSYTANANTTGIDNIADATNNVRYGTLKQKTDTGTPGALSLGFTTTYHDGGIALFEIKPNGTITEDASAPAVATATGAKTVTTAAFTPPAGALLVAMVTGLTDGFVLSDSTGLTWTQKSVATGDGNAEVWIAFVSSGVNGTGGVSLKKPALSGTGNIGVPGTGSVAIKKPALQGTGSAPVVGTGSVSLKKPTLQGSGTHKYIASGGVAVKKPALQGTGNLKIPGTGSVAVKKPALGGTGAVGASVNGTGSVAVKKPGLSGAGISSLLNNAEGGTNGTTVTTGNSGGASGNPFDTVTIGATASIIADNTHAAHGGLAYAFATGATSDVVYLKWSTSIGSLSTVFFRFYLYLSASASPAIRPFRISNSGGSHLCSVLVNGTSLSMSYGTSFTGVTAFSTAMPTGKWVRIEGYMTPDASAGVMSMSLYTDADSIVPVETKTYTSLATGAGPITDYWFGQGNTSANSGPFWLDDLGISAAGYIGPVGGPAGQNLINNAEGGTNTTTVTGGNSAGNSGGVSGSHWDTVQIATGGSTTFSTDHAAHGTKSYKIVTGSPATSGGLVWTTALTGPGTAKQLWSRAYVYLPAYPTVSTQLQVLDFRNGSTAYASALISPTGHVSIRNASNVTLATSVGVVPTGAWFRLELMTYGDATNGVVECKIFTTDKDGLVPDETLTGTGTNTTGPMNRATFSNPGGVASYTFYLDDLGASTSGYLGPAGISASGSVAIKKPALQGTGNLKISGTGSVAIKKPALSGSGLIVTGLTAYIGGVGLPATAKARIDGEWVSCAPKVRVGGEWVAIH